MTEAAHSHLGPSSSERWLNCPGSVLATKDLPEEPTEFSSSGTFTHALAQEAREKNIPAAKLIGRKWDDGKYAFVADRERCDRVQEFIDYVNGVPGDDYNETRIRYQEYVTDGFGTMDAAKAGTDCAHIIDLKDGAGIQVFAEDNSQLKLYALGFYLEHGWLYNLQEFVLTIYQPQLLHVDSFKITVKELLEWAQNVVKPIAASAMKPGAPFKAGDWCQKGFCKIRSTCKTRAQAVFGAMSGEMENLDTALSAPPVAVNTLSNDQVAAALRAQKIATGWFADLQSYAVAQIAKGHEIGMPSWKMVEGRSTRMFALDDEKQIVNAIKSEVNDPAFNEKTLYTEPKLKSAPQIEDLIGKKWFAPAKLNEAGAIVKNAGPLAHLIVKPKGAAVLAPPEDKRLPIAANAINELENLDLELDL